MSGIPPAQLREKVRRILETMRGYLSVWSLDITQIRRKNSNFIIGGRYTEAMLSTKWITFEITIDKNGNVIEAKTGGASAQKL